ncbi:Hsp33 family molecular chaperone HslO [Vibrio salinus]|uniref:Hsp33 family molecular chaperone HslO n=1 Tax=Vibrio salinus TaxID=2899784 RepID=UPI001E3F3D7D|nr:Hsp33 family molecular chaperone HslO [Vibrio salinus]MCE0493850.1 Hsp33 family molecular chaperone HslO [Vibrio salinus]
MAKNVLHRYLFEDLSVRGELVQLDDTYQQILSSTDYPAPVKTLLGELLVATTLLTATIKFEGSITLQLQGDGPVSVAVINGNNNQQVRGVARWEGELADDASLHDMMGKGQLIITIEPKQGERYQGIVALEGKNLAEVLESYFERSEQLKTRLWIRTDTRNYDVPQAAGMLLQIVPDGKGNDNDFEHLEQLTATIKSEELFTLDAQELLYRLYNQERVQLFHPNQVKFLCGCSRERSESAILTLDKNEVFDILKEQGKLSLHCDYCGTTYHFEKNEIEQLITSQEKNTNTLH